MRGNTQNIELIISRVNTQSINDWYNGGTDPLESLLVIAGQFLFFFFFWLGIPFIFFWILGALRSADRKSTAGMAGQGRRGH